MTKPNIGGGQDTTGSRTTWSARHQCLIITPASRDEFHRILFKGKRLPVHVKWLGRTTRRRERKSSFTRTETSGEDTLGQGKRGRTRSKSTPEIWERINDKER
ncbi:Hypothetical protein CINCED_3A000925 [Cinara cedri]|uniref:Uncharacterized protein n=1 Tax=Cinara cedri TaxID=506608 RepID=A0A5E4N7N2_9HEMI|nr:Hypothetical protein CINCED_3A000925 [Cinara cedri]